MVFANKTISDVLLRDELQQLAQQYSEQFKLWHVVSQVSDSEKEQWQYGTGRVNQVCYCCCYCCYYCVDNASSSYEVHVVMRVSILLVSAVMD
jgi:hypothetical protein